MVTKQYQYYWSGQNSYHDGLKEEDCPYKNGKSLSEWLRGYHDAQDDIEQPEKDEQDIDIEFMSDIGQ